MFPRVTAHLHPVYIAGLALVVNTQYKMLFSYDLRYDYQGF